MKKLASFLISGCLLFGAAACQTTAKTSADAPNDASKTQTEAAAPEATQATQKDAQSETRRRQANADIKAHEERNNALNGGSDTNRSENALASEVRSKLEVNIQKGVLAVKGDKDGTVTVTGTVANEKDLAKIEPLAKQIKGVKKVVVKATVAKAK